MNFQTFKALTRFEQTLFGLPFIFSATLLAWLVHGFLLSTFLLILLAFLCARISGMAFNQLIDRAIDARNPRTQHRVLAKGLVGVSEARALACSALVAFLYLCWKIHFLCFCLAPIAAFCLFIYSYMKRIHASCHFVLGIIHFLGPVMAFIAMTGTCSFSVIFLGLGALFSISGNDIVYAIQDYEFDISHKLHSMPSKIGIKKSLKLAILLHFFCVLSLIFVGIFEKLPLIYYAVIVAVAAVFMYFHRAVHRQYRKAGSIAGIESIFFKSSVLSSSAIFFFLSLGVIWDVWF